MASASAEASEVRRGQLPPQRAPFAPAEASARDGLATRVAVARPCSLLRSLTVPMHSLVAQIEDDEADRRGLARRILHNIKLGRQAPTSAVTVAYLYELYSQDGGW